MLCVHLCNDTEGHEFNGTWVRACLPTHALVPDRCILTGVHLYATTRTWETIQEDCKQVLGAIATPCSLLGDANDSGRLGLLHGNWVLPITSMALALLELSVSSY